MWGKNCRDNTHNFKRWSKTLFFFRRKNEKIKGTRIRREKKIYSGTEEDDRQGEKEK